MEAAGIVATFLSVGFPSLSRTNGASGASIRLIATTSASKKFFKSLEIKLSLRNLISQKVQYKQFENTTKGKVEELTREFNYGRNYGISVGYRF